MHINRQSGRAIVNIPVTLTTVLDSFDAQIVDLSEQGAQISGCAIEPGTRFHIEYLGQTIYAHCRWGEVDRMGVQFSFPLTEGPLYDELRIARAAQRQSEPAPAEPPVRAPLARAPLMAGPAVRGFGRRGI